MQQLTPDQLALITDHLRAAKLPTDLRDQLLDHLCCDLEDRMANGQSFASALNDIQTKWPLSRLKNVYRNIHFTRKIKPMLIKSTFLLLFFGALTTLYVPDSGDRKNTNSDLAQHEFVDPPTGSPISGFDPAAFNGIGFGIKLHPLKKTRVLHRGIDIIAESGTPVLATAAGRVTFAGDGGKNGISVRILHEDGYLTVYNHLSKTNVETGQLIPSGKIIGAVGSTGLSTRPHLHYEILQNEVAVDPLTVMLP